MHKEILSKEQVELLSWIKQFRREFYLVGGTAIAFYLGHRRSIDFDLFKFGNLNHKKNLERVKESGFDYQITRRVTEQMFRVQLSYFADVDYTESVDYIIENPPTNEQIKEELTRISIESI